MPQKYRKQLTHLERALLAEVQKKYRLCGKVEEINSLIVWEDRTLMAFTVNGQRYFLKQWPSYVDSEQEFTFILTLQAYARNKGVPIPEILKTENGEPILEWRNNRFSLQNEPQSRSSSERLFIEQMVQFLKSA